MSLGRARRNAPTPDEYGGASGRAERRLALPAAGAWSGIAGPLLSFVTNGLRPHPSHFQLELLLSEIGRSPIWSALHLALIVGLILSNIFAKLQVANRAEAILKARDAGLGSP